MQENYLPNGYRPFTDGEASKAGGVNARCFRVFGRKAIASLRFAGGTDCDTILIS